MKPIKFKVKKLGEIQSVKLEHGTPSQYLYNGSGTLAYQLTPEADYSDYVNTRVTGFVMGRWHGLTNYYRFDGEVINLEISINNPLHPFLIPSEHYSSFRDAVHSYNLKYCDVPDVKVLDGFVEWVHNKISDYSKFQYKRNVVADLMFQYKATLVSPESWFEEVNE